MASFVREQTKVLQGFMRFLSRVGNRDAQMIMRMVSAGDPTKNVDAFTKAVSPQVNGTRRQVRVAAFAFYRLYSALGCGAAPSFGGERQQTLASLLQRLESAIGTRLPLVLPEQKVDLYRVRPPGNDWRWDRSFASKTREIASMYSGTVEGLQGKLAAKTVRAAQDAGRGISEYLGSRDRKAIGWVRVSGTGSPCAFCALMMSRIRLRSELYKSEESAGSTYDGNPYHDNCHCFPVPVYSMDELKRGEQFALNRKARQVWNKHGASGRDLGLYTFRRAWEGRADGARADRWQGPNKTARDRARLDRLKYR